MSKTKKNLTTININKSNNDFENSQNTFTQSGVLSKKRSNQLNSTSIMSQNSNSTNSTNVAVVSQIVMKKRHSRVNKEISLVMETSLTESEFSKPSKPLPSYYCININQDGFRNMDKVSHLNEEEIENKPLEYQLRPISGIRNHIKRNVLSSQPIDVIKDTDLMQRIGSVKTLKRLDLSFNNLQVYPRQLCDLTLLESLNLSNNSLTETDFPSDWDRYQNLIELILDFNQLKRVPKTLCKSKKLLRLSLRNNCLAEFKNIENFKRLKYLILDHNSLTTIDESLKNLEKLEILYLNHNSIQILQPSVFKSSLYCLKQLDLSYNKLQSISTEVFMLPHLESLNLSRNSLTRLPSIPITYFRTQPIFSIDLSSNNLVRFYDYLLNIGKNIDLSSNKIKNIPSKLIQRLTEKQLNNKTLKLENNPLLDPPQEICKFGLKNIKEYFDEASRQIQLNKGFKIIILGEPKSGKTSLAYALEDLNSQSNLIEQYSISDFDESESRFIEIHEFSINTEIDVDIETQSQISANDLRPGSSLSIKSQKSVDKRTNSSKSSKPIASKKTKTNEELNAFSNINLNNSINKPMSTISEQTTKKSMIPITIYDFNGNLEQFGKLTDLFLDKSALILLCVDASSFSEPDIGKNEVIAKKLSTLLDSLLLKMSKNNSFCILPVITKCDKVDKLSSSNIRRIIAQEVETYIKNHINNRLAAIKEDLKEIELLPQISASQSDRLKQLVQTQNNLNPDIYKKCLPISAIKMEGITLLSNSIKEIAFNNTKHFPEVNKKVPAFWIEVENFACNILSEMPQTKYVDDRIKIITNSAEPNLSILCVDYLEYKEKIVEKYGMSHLVDQITKYMNTSGKIIWYHDMEKLRKRVFLRPNILFDLIFVLFRTNFNENFTDVHKQALRSKLVHNVNMSDENIKNLSNEFLTKGVLSIDLLKMLWFPILITDSTHLVQEAITLFSDFFLLCYPALPKDKLKTQFQSYTKKADDGNFNDSIYSSFINHNHQKPNMVHFSSVIVPFYLPMLNDQSVIYRIKSGLENECQSATQLVLSLGIKKTRPTCLTRISQRYFFPWGLMPGIFEKFSVNCVINSDLYYRNHYKNFIYGYNEDNSIGVIIYTNALNDTDVCNEVIFEFYITSYQQIIDSLENTTKDSEFDQTTEMDLDQIWIIALKILHLFEDTINYTYPSLRYDRWSLCPQCEKFTFFGEWVTPKELQKLKTKICPACEKTIQYSYLVRPSTGQNLTLDMKRMQQRLEKLSKMDSSSKSITTSVIQPKVDPRLSIHSETNSIVKFRKKNSVISITHS